MIMICLHIYSLFNAVSVLTVILRRSHRCLIFCLSLGTFGDFKRIRATASAGPARMTNKKTPGEQATTKRPGLADWSGTWRGSKEGGLDRDKSLDLDIGGTAAGVCNQEEIY